MSIPPFLRSVAEIHLENVRMGKESGLAPGCWETLNRKPFVNRFNYTTSGKESQEFRSIL